MFSSWTHCVPQISKGGQVNLLSMSGQPPFQYGRRIVSFAGRHRVYPGRKIRGPKFENAAEIPCLKGSDFCRISEFELRISYFAQRLKFRRVAQLRQNRASAARVCGYPPLSDSLLAVGHSIAAPSSEYPVPPGFGPSVACDAARSYHASGESGANRVNASSAFCSFCRLAKSIVSVRHRHHHMNRRLVDWRGRHRAPGRRGRSGQSA